MPSFQLQSLVAPIAFSDPSSRKFAVHVPLYSSQRLNTPQNQKHRSFRYLNSQLLYFHSDFRVHEMFSTRIVFILFVWLTGKIVKLKSCTAAATAAIGIDMGIDIIRQA